MPRPSVQGLGYGTSPTYLAFSKKNGCSGLPST